MLNYDIQVKVAATQMEPVWYNAHETVSKMIKFIEEAAANKAKAVSFGECIVPGYMYHVYTDNPNDPLSSFGQKDYLYAHNALEIDGPEMRRVMRAARDNQIYVIFGYVERCNGTRYMSQAIIGDNGKILLNRRKFRPTYMERLINGEGSGADLQVVSTPIGNIGTTQCWEHTQPLITYAMCSMHEQLHFSCWPGNAWVGKDYLEACQEGALMFSRIYAMQTQTYTVVSSGIVGPAAFEFFCGEDETKKRIMGQYGGGIAQIIDPAGQLLCESLPADQEGILYADIDLNKNLAVKAELDPVGHYSRPDIFCLHINKNPQPHTRVINDFGVNTLVDSVNAEFETENQ